MEEEGGVLPLEKFAVDRATKVPSASGSVN